MLSIVYDLEEIFSWTRTYNPFKLAFRLDFEVIFTDDLPGERLGLAVPELKVLFISSCIKGSKFSYFICAHELVHCTEHEGIQAFYNCSERTQGRFEQEADSEGIYVLCKFYLEQFPELDRLNVTTVANYFELNEEFYSIIEKHLRSLVEY